MDRPLELETWTLANLIEEVIALRGQILQLEREVSSLSDRLIQVEFQPTTHSCSGDSISDWIDCEKDT